MKKNESVIALTPLNGNRIAMSIQIQEEERPVVSEGNISVETVTREGAAVAAALYVPSEAAKVTQIAGNTVFSMLLAIGFSHFLNDTIQSLIPAIYPIVRDSFKLSYSQVGMLTLTFQLTASLLQPFVGMYSDKKSMPYSLAFGMTLSLLGLILLSRADSYTMLLFSVGLVGAGSSIFHPEASRVAQLASGGRRGLAQSIFQVGGNAGSALGPLLAALIVVRFGQHSIAWFSAVALLAIAVLFRVGKWYGINKPCAKKKTGKASERFLFSPGKTAFSIGILLVLMFSKNFYMASMGSYFTFYLMDKFKLTVESAQMHLFVFLASVAVGVLVGGPLGDRFGRKYVIWASILGAAPFTLMLPYADLFWTDVLIVIIGLVLASAMSAIIVFAQELIPGKVGMISGLFFGFAFGIGGVGSALLGKLADYSGIQFVYQVCAFLPLIGLVTYFLPNIEGRRKAKAELNR